MQLFRRVLSSTGVKGSEDAMPVRKTRTINKFNPDFVQVFEESARATAERFLKLQSETLTRQLRDAILGQKYNWYPLDPKYLRRKVRQGFDPRILVRTKQYVESLQVSDPEQIENGILYRVEVPDEDHNSGLPFRELARIMEFGRRDGKKPYARPHWRPTWGIFVRDLPTVTSQFKSEILTDFRQKLSSTNA